MAAQSIPRLQQSTVPSQAVPHEPVTANRGSAPGLIARQQKFKRTGRRADGAAQDSREAEEPLFSKSTSSIAGIAFSAMSSSPVT